MSVDQLRADLYAILSTLAELPEGQEIIESHAYIVLGMDYSRWIRVKTALLASTGGCKPLVECSDSHLMKLTKDGRIAGDLINKALKVKADERRGAQV